MARKKKNTLAEQLEASEKSHARFVEYLKESEPLTDRIGNLTSELFACVDDYLGSIHRKEYDVAKEIMKRWRLVMDQLRGLLDEQGEMQKRYLKK